MKMYAFGALAPTLKEQGYPLTDKQHALVDQMCDGLNTMHIQGIVTSKEYDRITDRMWKQIEGWCKKNEAKPCDCHPQDPCDCGRRRRGVMQ